MWVLTRKTMKSLQWMFHSLAQGMCHLPGYCLLEAVSLHGDGHLLVFHGTISHQSVAHHSGIQKEKKHSTTKLKQDSHYKHIEK